MKKICQNCKYWKTKEKTATFGVCCFKYNKPYVQAYDTCNDWKEKENKGD